MQDSIRFSANYANTKLRYPVKKKKTIRERQKRLNYIVTKILLAYVVICLVNVNLSVMRWLTQPENTSSYS